MWAEMRSVTAERGPPEGGTPHSGTSWESRLQPERVFGVPASAGPLVLHWTAQLRLRGPGLRRERCPKYLCESVGPAGWRSRQGQGTTTASGVPVTDRECQIIPKHGGSRAFSANDPESPSPPRPFHREAFFKTSRNAVSHSFVPAPGKPSPAKVVELPLILTTMNAPWPCSARRMASSSVMRRESGRHLRYRTRLRRDASPSAVTNRSPATMRHATIQSEADASISRNPIQVPRLRVPSVDTIPNC